MFQAKTSTDDKYKILDLLKNTDRTYQSIGDEFGISRERVRQLAQKEGLQGLGHQKRSQKRSQIKDEKLTKLYGQFYKENRLHELDFISVCKEKLRNKQRSNTKFEWTIEFKDIVWNTQCPILGLELDYFAEGRQENSPSFDRLDITKGYIPGNVQIISWRANRIKNDGTAEEHYRIAKYLETLGY